MTLEPCAMCAGAIILARVPRVVFAAPDPKAGACGSVLDVLGEARLNHRPEVTAGVLADEAGQMLREFFRERRGGSAWKPADQRQAPGSASGFPRPSSAGR